MKRFTMQVQCSAVLTSFLQDSCALLAGVQIGGSCLVHCTPPTVRRQRPARVTCHLETATRSAQAGRLLHSDGWPYSSRATSLQQTSRTGLTARQCLCFSCRTACFTRTEVLILSCLQLSALVTFALQLADWLNADTLARKDATGKQPPQVHSCVAASSGPKVLSLSWLL